MKKLTFIFLFLSASSIFANITYINFTNIPGAESHIKEINYLFENILLYDVWTPNWTSNIPKSDVIKELKRIHDIFNKIPDREKNIEVLLALGDISHFLYNLDEKDYYEQAVNFYLSAKKMDISDYRAYWFLGNHYALSARQEESVNQFFIAKEKIPNGKKILEFWEEYAFAFNLAGMTSNSIYGMSQAKAILGEPCYLEKTLGEAIKSRLIKSPIDTTYKYTDIWTSHESDKTYTCSCRPWGIKVTFDKSWGNTFADYKNRSSYFVLKPDAIKGYNKSDVTYSIAVINRIPKENENLNSWLNQMTAPYPTKTKIEFSNKYENIVAYELKAPEMYTSQGGGHMYVIGFEKEPPLYPGLDIEIPVSFKSEKDNTGPNYFRLNSSFTRFDSKVQYIIILDACEAIHDEALKVFKDFFENKFFIE